jgi:squalene synthase HpnC
MTAGPDIEAAFAHCAARVRAHYENFPVGLFVPRSRARYVHALYAFARAADDFADEPAYEGRRIQLLDNWEARLHRACAGQADDPVFVALGETVRRLAIPKDLLLDLLSAFRQDVHKRRYESWDELRDYCRRSAEPVGRLVLLVFDQRDAQLAPLSDAICTGLQLANHWQDLALDLNTRERLYVPRLLLEQHGVSEADLRAARVDARYTALMADLLARTRALFDQGRPLCDRVPGRLRFELRLTWLGGRAILDGIERVGGDVFRQRPRHGTADKLRLAWRALRWRASRA